MSTASQMMPYAIPTKRPAGISCFGMFSIFSNCWASAVPDDNASTTAKNVFARNPYQLRGRSLYYASAIGTEPMFADVILEQVAAFDAVEPASVFA